MLKLAVLLITMLTLSLCNAQSIKKEKPDSIYSKVDQSAEFKGGTNRLYSYLGDKLDMPPDEKKVNGRVFVEFVVNKDGSISDESVRAVPFSELTKTRPNLKEADVLKDSFCVEEATQLFKDSPNWMPAKHEGVAVRQRVVMPIKFDNTTTK